MSRSENMRRIRSKDTSPELVVRRTLCQLGYRSRYRIHRKELPGKPDIAFMRRKKAILVHGCFWHGHDCKEGSRRPKSNQGYWLPKITKNQERDHRAIYELQRLGWSLLVVWECEARDGEGIARRLGSFLAE